MNKVNKFGMLFNGDNMPDFGSIELAQTDHNVILLSEDITKLNTVLTETACTPYLISGETFSFHTGDIAFIIDWLTEETGSMYMYHKNTDTWYEIVPNE